MRSRIIMMLLSLSALTCFSQDRQRPFQVRFTPGFDFAHLTISNSPVFRHVNVRLGGEVEIYLPTERKRTWGVILEPAYQSFSEEDAGFRYESIEASLGVRYRVFLKDKGYLFTNVMFLLDVPITHSQRYALGTNSNILLVDDSIEGGFAGGIGYGYGRFSLEGRYYKERLRQGLLPPSFPYRYGKTSIILGFRLF